MPASPVRPRRDDVRTAVIGAAADLFAAQGYRDTTLGQIAAAAGFTKGAIFSNFDGKPELFAAAVAGRFRTRADDAVRAAAGLGQDARRHLARQLAEITVSDSWSVRQLEFALLARTDEAVAAAYAEIRREQVARLVDQLREHASKLSLDPEVDLDATAVVLLTTISGLAIEHQVTPALMSPERIERVFLRLLEGLQQ